MILSLNQPLIKSNAYSICFTVLSSQEKKKEGVSKSVNGLEKFCTHLHVRVHDLSSENLSTYH